MPLSLRRRHLDPHRTIRPGGQDHRARGLLSPPAHLLPQI